MTEDLHHLAAAYALDALEADEARRFEDHLALCEHCPAEVCEFRATASELGASAAVAPPPGLRAQVLAEVAGTRQQPPAVVDLGAVRRARRLAPMLVAAAVLAVVLGAGVVVRDLAAQRDRAEELAAVVTAPDARIVALEGTDGGTVRLVWSPSRSATVLVAADLPPAGRGRIYELWAFAADGPRSAGVFEPGSDGGIRRVLALPGDPVDGWGVTLEPVDGTPQPDGEVVFQST